MTSESDHVWGISKAADYVRSEVSGVVDWKNYSFMVVQAVIDDSYDKTVFVLAGYMASAPVWIDFAKDWDEHLKYCQIKSFKLSQMGESRPEVIGSFYKIIERHPIPLSFDCVLDISMWNEEVAKLRLPENEYIKNLLSNPYYFVSKKLMYYLYSLADSIGVPGPLDLIFDEQEKEKKAIFEAWDYFKRTMPDAGKKHFGSIPAFKNDELFLPIQAADMIAGFVRKAEVAGKKPYECDIFPWKWKLKPKMQRLAIRFEREEIAEELQKMFSKENYEKVMRYFLENNPAAISS